MICVNFLLLKSLQPNMTRPPSFVVTLNFYKMMVDKFLLLRSAHSQKNWHESFSVTLNILKMICVNFLLLKSLQPNMNLATIICSNIKFLQNDGG